MIIDIKLLNSEAVIPTRANDFDAGYDLYATEPTVIFPFERKLIKTGISVSIPEGYYGRIAPRSGLALKKGIDVMAGVIDATYRAEVGVLLVNLDIAEYLSMLLNKAPIIAGDPPGAFRINKGDRIAQIIIEKCHTVEWNLVENLSATVRGQGGFGSTGV